MAEIRTSPGGETLSGRTTEPSGSTARVVLAGQMALLFANAIPGQLITVANASLLVWVLSATAAPWLAYSWWLAVLVVALGRLAIVHGYRAAEAVDGEVDAVHWRRRFVFGVATAGLVWGGGALLFMLGAPKEEQLFTGFVMAGMVAGAVPMLSPDFGAFRAFAMPIVLAVAGAMLWQASSTLDWAFGIMAVIFLIAVLQSARAMNRTLTDSLRLAEEKSQLVVDLELARAAAEAASRTKGQFLANMSHEVRTPMNGIIGMTDLLIGTELNAEQREYAQIVRDSAASLLTIITDILDFSKMEAGELDMQSMEFDTVETLEGILNPLAERAAAKGLGFAQRFDPALSASLCGDPGRLRQVISHLVGNAIKFTERGEVTVDIALLEQGAGEVRLRVEVGDTGIGMPADKVSGLFSPFTQIDGSATRRYGGTGLGLAIARRLVELMGGKIGVVSEEGKGSTFWFTVRLERPA
jgi:signal transduction histidine kinase